MKTTTDARIFLATSAIALCLAGCGQRSGRPDLDAIPAEELHGASTKGLLYEFRAKVRKYGVTAAKKELPTVLEAFADYEQQPIGSHKDTYRQIAEKLKALETTLAGSPTKDAAIQAADEIGALADKLPGKANPNPQVE